VAGLCQRLQYCPPLAGLKGWDPQGGGQGRGREEREGKDVRKGRGVERKECCLPSLEDFLWAPMGELTVSLCEGLINVIKIKSRFC